MLPDGSRWPTRPDGFAALEIVVLGRDPSTDP
jgi:hypothetical protein